MNKTLYLVIVLGGLISSGLLTAWGLFDSQVSELLLFSWLPIIPAIIFIDLMIYKMWAVIQDGQARTTPGKAVGFTFIPFYNFYWIFQAFYGWAKDYNAYIARQGIKSDPVPEKIFLWYVILIYLTFIPFVGLVALLIQLVLLTIIIVKVSNAFGAIKNR